MTRWHGAGVALLAAVIGMGARARAQDAAPPVNAATAGRFLAEHCVRCHGADKQEGKLRLDVLGANFDERVQARVWIEVMDKLNLGEMPPDGQPRPPADAQQGVVRWIATELRAADRRSRGFGGRALLRRMNRVEYANTVRDLLHLKFLPGDSPVEFLPPDGRAEGFDKAAVALTIDPSLLEKYYEVGRRIAEIGIVTGPPQFATYRNRFEVEDTAKRGSIRYLCAQPGFLCREHDVVLMEGGTRSFDDLFYPGTKRQRIPTKGMYAVRVRAAADPGGRSEPVVMQVIRESGGEGVLLETPVAAAESAPEVYEKVLPLGTDGGEFSVRIKNGTRFYTFNRAYLAMNGAVERVGKDQDFAAIMRIKGRMAAEGVLSGSSPNPATLDTTAVPKLFVDWIEIEGPLYEQWPPKSHASLLFKGAEGGGGDERAYVREIFTRFLPQAYRRPVAPAEVEPLAALVAQERAQGASFEEALRVGLSAVLASPGFIYLFEPGGEERRTLDDYELASRLSYFLWSSMPDERLFELARAGRLHEAAVLAAEVERMLADEKSRALVDGFGAQWLRTDEFRNFKPDEKLYRTYNEQLGAAMVAQTLAFFEHVLRNDLSVLNFIDSDFTLLNERLARFYGIEGVAGEEFRVVSLPTGSPRGGLLGQAGVALRGSDGTRTKPVNRGVYVREVLFNDPPDPPPPNAGEIEPNVQGKALTVRQRLEQHQQIAACAACHRGIDPYGLALENFSAIGAWRDRQDGEDFRRERPLIETSGRLPNGEAFESYAEFKQLLLKQRARFLRALSEKLFVYALGRPPEPSDRSTIDAMAEQPAGQESFRRSIQALVASRTFATK